MKVVYSNAHNQHEPQAFLVRGAFRHSPETPLRAETLLQAAREAEHEIVTPEQFGPGPRAAVHTPAYLDFLATAYEHWRQLGDGAQEVIANVHPGRQPVSYPRSLVGRAGFHMADGACPIGENTWEAACAAADCAVQAAELVLDGEQVAYALCRPPGHHAFADMAGGFCFLNNTAIAARHLRGEFGRVAILDIDVHHGNGTQSIFYRRADVLHVSLHADPNDFYPFFWGYAHERGEGSGAGYTLNLPLPVGTGDEIYLGALQQGLNVIRTYAPEAIIVALGLDAFENDPLAGMNITTEGFWAIGQEIGTLALPTVLVQEGGYPCPELGDNLVSFLDGFEQAL